MTAARRLEVWRHDADEWRVGERRRGVLRAHKLAAIVGAVCILVESAHFARRLRRRAERVVQLEERALASIRVAPLEEEAQHAFYGDTLVERRRANHHADAERAIELVEYEQMLGLAVDEAHAALIVARAEADSRLQQCEQSTRAAPRAQRANLQKLRVQRRNDVGVC